MLPVSKSVWKNLFSQNSWLHGFLLKLLDFVCENLPNNGKCDHTLMLLNTLHDCFTLNQWICWISVLDAISSVVHILIPLWSFFFFFLKTTYSEFNLPYITILCLLQYKSLSTLVCLQTNLNFFSGQNPLVKRAPTSPSFKFLILTNINMLQFSLWSCSDLKVESQSHLIATEDESRQDRFIINEDQCFCRNM